jgi:hypothetical protein
MANPTKHLPMLWLPESGMTPTDYVRCTIRGSDEHFETRPFDWGLDWRKWHAICDRAGEVVARIRCCHTEHRQCLYCGAEFKTTISQPRIYCSRECRMADYQLQKQVVDESALESLAQYACLKSK